MSLFLKYKPLIIFILLASCEKTIEIDFKNADKQLVIEGIIDNLGNPPVVKVSKTVGFSAQEFDFVNDAIVILSDSAEITDTLTCWNSGIYVSYKITGIPEHTYFLKVEYKENICESKCKMPMLQRIDSLGFLYERLFDPMTEPGYRTACYFTVPEGERKYFRLKLCINQIDVYGFNLESSRGGIESFMFRDDEITYGDSLKVLLYSIDRNVYEYYRTLSRIAAPDFQAFTPYNPKSNISNSALGYFSAMCVDSACIMMNKKY